MSEIWAAFKEVLSEEQLNDEVKKRLFAKLIPTIAEAFNQILSEEQLSDEVKNSLLFKLITDLAELEPPTIEVLLNPHPFGLSDEQIERIRQNRDIFLLCIEGVRTR
jgi:hypothetical protein